MCYFSASIWHLLAKSHNGVPLFQLGCLASIIIKGTIMLGIIYYFGQIVVKDCLKVPGFRTPTLWFPAWCHDHTRVKGCVCKYPSNCHYINNLLIVSISIPYLLGEYHCAASSLCSSFGGITNHNSCDLVFQTVRDWCL